MSSDTPSEKPGKKVVRALVRERLRALSADLIAAKSARLCAKIASLPEWGGAGVVCLFAAQPTEPDLEPLWHCAAGKTICYPRINGVALDFIAVESPAELETSRWQLREPIHDEARILPPERFDLVFVPGLAFSRSGLRLGRGGGFYDRLLAHPGLRARRIGVCFEEQIFADVPHEPHDCAVDVVLTDGGAERENANPRPAR